MKKARWFVVLSTPALCASLAACGGDSSSGSPVAATPVAAPTPAPCTQSLLLQGSTSLGSRFVSQDMLSVSTAGRLDVILDWTFANSPIAVWVVQGACSIEQLNARTCNFLIRSESGAKPRKVSASVSAGTYALLVGNGATESESLSVQVFLSSSTCAPLAGGGAGSQSLGETQFDGLVNGMLRHH